MKHSFSVLQSADVLDLDIRALAEPDKFVYRNFQQQSNGLRVVDSWIPLSTLLEWHLADPVDAAERKRNDLVYSDYQRNRNPFVDHPEWIMAIYASPKSQSRLSNPKAHDGMIATPGSPPVLVQSFRCDIELARPGKFEVLKSTDPVHWVEAKQSVPGRLHVGFPRDDPSCFFRVGQRPDGD